MSDNRIDMEEKIAFLEKQFSDLDSAVGEINNVVRKLSRDLDALRLKYDTHLADLHEPELPEGTSPDEAPD
ncbi:MAG: hypothetical protein ACLFV3_04765 [Phycisphaeraceae bacterium]